VVTPSPTTLDFMATTVMESSREAADAARWWWIMLVTGGAWILFSIIILRFDWTTVSAISILFGIAMLGFAATEFVAAFVTESGWAKVARFALAFALVVIGIVAFVHPGNTFKALAAVMSFAFILKGILDVIMGIAGIDGNRWLTILLGVLQIAIGFWAAGDFGHRAVLLVVWIGASALLRGIADIVLAFQVRGATD
jgi:uncharacterized membrane protein HdeD (DUF308 family)